MIEEFVGEFDPSDIDEALSREFSEFKPSADADEQVPAVEDDVPAEVAMSMEEVYSALEKKGISRATVDAWKSRFGAIYLFAPSETDIYVWRPIYKREWDAINNQVPQGQTPEDQQAIDAKLERLVIGRCVVFPKVTDEFVAGSRAGLMSTLFNIILQGSYFFSPQAALSLVIEL